MANTPDNTGEKPRLGNTLDFYNDEMPRKAVGRLFDNLDLDESDEIVKNYKKGELDESAKPYVRRGMTDEYDISIYQKRNHDEEIEELMNKPKPKRRRSKAKEPRDDSSSPMQKLNALFESTKSNSSTAAPIRMFVSIVFFVLILILAMLIIKVNSSSRLLAENEEKVAQATRLQNEYDLMQVENQRMSKEIEELQAQLQAMEASPTNISGTSEQSGGEQAQAGANSSTAPQNYTVVAGDNLSKISQRFYGTPNEYRKIMDANSLSSEMLRVGQVLIIP